VSALFFMAHNIGWHCQKCHLEKTVGCEFAFWRCGVIMSFDFDPNVQHLTLQQVITKEKQEMQAKEDAASQNIKRTRQECRKKVNKYVATRLFQYAPFPDMKCHLQYDKDQHSICEIMRVGFDKQHPTWQEIWNKEFRLAVNDAFSTRRSNIQKAIKANLKGKSTNWAAFLAGWVNGRRCKSNQCFGFWICTALLNRDKEEDGSVLVDYDLLEKIKEGQKNQQEYRWFVDNTVGCAVNVSNWKEKASKTPLDKMVPPELEAACMTLLENVWLQTFYEEGWDDMPAPSPAPPGWTGWPRKDDREKHYYTKWTSSATTRRVLKEVVDEKDRPWKSKKMDKRGLMQYSINCRMVEKNRLEDKEKKGNEDTPLMESITEIELLPTSWDQISFQTYYMQVSKLELEQSVEEEAERKRRREDQQVEKENQVEGYYMGTSLAKRQNYSALEMEEV